MKNITLSEKEKEEEKEYKKQIFKRYNYLSENQKNNKERNNLFNIIVRNYWLQEYFELYSNNEFGL